MSRPQHDENHVGKASQDRRQGLDHVLDALVRRQQTEREQHELSFDPKMVFVKARIDKRHVGNSMRNEIDFFFGNVVNFSKEIFPPLAHHDQSVRQSRQLLQHPTLAGIRLAQHRMQRCHHGHLQTAQ